MAGFPNMYETSYGAGEGYADVGSYALDEAHLHFIVWLVVFALAAVAVLGGLKMGGFHFVVKV
jgi:hypothetical protein